MGLVRRVYKCDSPACGFQFHAWQDKTDPLLAECPECAADSGFDDARERAENQARISDMLESGIPPARTTHRSVAMKHAESMMADYGMTNFNDDGKPGTIAAKAPSPPQTAEREALTREMVDAGLIHNEQQAEAFSKGAGNFWQPGHEALAEAAKTNPVAAAIHRAPMIAPAAAAQARAEGVDPVSLFHKAGKEGHLRKTPNIVAAVKG